MGEIIALVFCIGIFLAGFISGKSIYKDELNDLDNRFRSVKKWWIEGIEERKHLKVFKMKIRNIIDGTGTIQQKYQKIKDLVQEYKSTN